MGYHTDILSTAKWLASIQRPDNGWGLAPGQASSLVNTAEAIFVLSRTAGYAEATSRGFTYIYNNAFAHLTRHGPRIRYIAFSLFAASLLPNSARNFEFIEQCTKWLLEARNPDAAWGIEERDNSSHLFSTFLALWSLQSVDCPDATLRPAYQWLLSQASDTGWSLRVGQGPAVVATAYSALVLAKTSFAAHDRLRVARSLLLQTRHWGTEEEVIAGTVWKHCTFAYVLPALMALEESPYSTTVAEGIRYINTLRLPSVGWSESEPTVGQTIRAQFWAVLALESIYRAFDPAIHILRIDAERVQEALSEPQFVKVAIHSPWATIVPSRVYKMGAYGSTSVALLFLLGAHHALAKMPPRVDALIALALLWCTHMLIRKRKRYFPLTARVFEWSVAALSAASFVVGTDLESFMVAIQKKLHALIGLFFR